MNLDRLRTLPKAVLHDHLDGGLRVDTIIDLAADAGYEALPTVDPDELRRWFHQGESGSLERYLEAFVHTTGVMQTAEALERVAYEAVLDLAEDSVVYAELRFAPSLHTSAGLDRSSAIAATLRGLAKAEAETEMVTGLIAVAMRDGDDSYEVARAAAEFAAEGVVGFDLAGPEAGHPADRHLPACRYAQENGLGLTIHGGEGDGPNSVWRAVNRCSADRVGHGVHVIEDAVVTDGDVTRLGAVARYVRDMQIPLEVAISSNLHTGAYATAALHPFGALFRAGFAVTINTDNRLMSGIDLTHEYALAATTFSLSAGDLGRITETAITAGFGDWPTRRRLIEDVVRPAYAATG